MEVLNLLTSLLLRLTVSDIVPEDFTYMPWVVSSAFSFDGIENVGGFPVSLLKLACINFECLKTLAETSVVLDEAFEPHLIGDIAVLYRFHIKWFLGFEESDGCLGDIAIAHDVSLHGYLRRRVSHVLRDGGGIGASYEQVGGEGASARV